MTNYKKENKFVGDFIEWWKESELEDYTFVFLACSYNPEIKDKIISDKKFGFHNVISDKKYFASEVSRIVKSNVNGMFEVSFVDQKVKWLLPEDFNNKEMVDVKYYLKRKLPGYIGKFKIKNLFKFLILFFDYEFKLNRQPIIIESIKNDFLIHMSSFYTIFFVTKLSDGKLLLKLGKELDEAGFTVLFSDNLKKEKD
ncbi:hypothetical protein BH10BAC5_BH10BAC5_25000 [soil metagenome]